MGAGEPPASGSVIERESSPASRRIRPTLIAFVRASAWLGITGFGGGISVLAAMRERVVVRRRWLTEREFVATATVAQMLPGGAAANALAYTGLRHFGAAGAVLAYLAFIAPGAVVVTVLAAATLLMLSRFRVNPVTAMALGGAARLALRAAGI